MATRLDVLQAASRRSERPPLSVLEAERTMHASEDNLASLIGRFEFDTPPAATSADQDTLEQTVPTIADSYRLAQEHYSSAAERPRYSRSGKTGCRLRTQRPAAVARPRLRSRLQRQRSHATWCFQPGSRNLTATPGRRDSSSHSSTGPRRAESALQANSLRAQPGRAARTTTGTGCTRLHPQHSARCHDESGDGNSSAGSRARPAPI